MKRFCLERCAVHRCCLTAGCLLLAGSTACTPGQEMALGDSIASGQVQLVAFGGEFLRGLIAAFLI